ARTAAGRRPRPTGGAVRRDGTGGALAPPDGRGRGRAAGSSLVNPSASLATWLVDRLVERGLTDVVLCPGSRNAPLSFALAADERVRLHTRIDERAAAFVALGLARSSRRP